MIIFDILYSIFYILMVIIAVLLVVVLAIPAGILYVLYLLVSKPFKKGTKKRKKRSYKVPFKSLNKGPKGLHNIVNKAIRSSRGDNEIDSDEFKTEIEEFVAETIKNSSTEE